ncbi:hypothetical protein QYF36_018003 [Acer negundo]|nr:hypothetical protein QYF36_018003 [Acer negundo]
MNKRQDFIGLGAAIRYDKGQVLLALSKPLRGSFSMEIGELLALHEGLILAKQHVVNGCWAEADAVNVVAAVNNCEPTNGVAGFLIDDVNALFADVQVFKCQDILRNENSFTHNLTLVDVYSKKIQLWQDICFRDLLNVLS